MDEDHRANTVGICGDIIETELTRHGIEDHTTWDHTVEDERVKFLINLDTGAGSYNMRTFVYAEPGEATYRFHERVKDRVRSLEEFYLQEVFLS